MDRLQEENLDIRFEHFYKTHFPRVKNFARMLIKSEADAEDIAKNIFLKLWSHPELWQKEGMDNYLYTVTRNEIFNLFKHQRIEQEYEEKIQKARLIRELCEEDTSLLDNIYQKEMMMLIKMALSRMPEKRKQAFEMSRFDGLSYREIAEKLQISQRTAEDHVYKVLSELRKLLTYVIIPHLFP